MASLSPLKNAVTLVTGGASGLGRACVERFVKQGSRVVFCDLKTSEGARIAEDLGRNCLFIPTDVRSEENVKDALQITEKKFGQLNYVINCAGIGLVRRTYITTNQTTHSLESFLELLKINTSGTLNVTGLAAGLMFKNEPNEDGQRGVVINTASVAAYDGQIGQVAYSASKGAIVAMTLPMARDLSAMGIRVNCIAPGIFDTALLASLPEKIKGFVSSTIPFPKRPGKPDEFAMFCQRIIENPLINGEVIRLDGAGLILTLKSDRMLQASRHQGSQIYRGNGRQCVANSLHAVLASQQTSPSKWTKTTLDQILEKGDKLYCELVPETNKYLLFRDIPTKIENYTISIQESLCGTLRREKTEMPFYSITDAIDQLMNNDSSCLFTMGQFTPSYTCAILKNLSEFYFFDPHSRADTGMVTAEGLATLTVHKHTQNLCLFLKHLAASLGNADDTPFEIAKINITDNEMDTDSDSDFSGYSTLSEGDVACKLFLAEEMKNTVDISDVSDVSSVSGFDTSSIGSIDSAVLENLENNLHDSFLESFNDEVLETALGGSDSENPSQKVYQNMFENVDDEHGDCRIYDEDDEFDDDEFDDYDDDFRDKDYNPNDSKETDDDDDDEYYDNFKAQSFRIKQKRLRSDGDSLNALNNGTQNIYMANDNSTQVSSSTYSQDTQFTNNLGSQRIQVIKDNSTASSQVASQSGTPHTQVTTDNTTQCTQVTNESSQGREVTSDNITQSTQVSDNGSQSTKVTGDQAAQSTQVTSDSSQSSEVASDNITRISQVNDNGSQSTRVTGDQVAQSTQVTSDSSQSSEVASDNVTHISQASDNGSQSTKVHVTGDQAAQSTQVTRDGNSTSTQVSGDYMERTEKRGRKRKRNEDNWKRNIHKRRRNQGKSYTTRTGKIRSARTLKSGCAHTCRYKCKSKFNESERQSIFHSYWQLGDVNKQRQFIAKYAAIKIKNKNKLNSGGRRKWTVSYSLPQVQENGKSVAIKVCKTFFQDTIGITDRVVSTVLKKLSAIGVCMEDNRGKHDSRPNRASQSQITGVRKHIESFQPIESHYCRKDSAKKYLPADLNVTRMYDMYTENCPLSEKPASINIYRRIFNEEYNLSFHTPIKDQCDFCAAFRNASPEEKENMKHSYEKHIQNKELAKQNKETDKQKAKNDETEKFVAACFDLEEVLQTPHSFESSLYYKRRLSTYNFTLYDLGTSDGYSFIWNETVSSRGANEIASCVYSFINEKSNKGKKEFVFYSDNCFAQNKNRFYATMLWYCLQKFDLLSVEHKYLEKGHTFNENDSVHSAVEGASRNVPVYTTPQWAATVRKARPKRPYKVKEMSLADFFDFKKIAEKIKNFDVNTKNDKVYWSKIKALKLTSSLPNILHYKTDYNEQFSTVD